MFILFYFFSFVLGLALGSFINCLIYRIKNKLPTFLTRSQCLECNKNLLIRDNIPILGYLFLKGRCRYCRAKIPPRYLYAELLSGLLVVLLFYLNGFHNVFSQTIFFEPNIIESIKFLLTIIFYLTAFVTLVTVFIYDYKFFLIPNKIVFPGILLFTALNLLADLLQSISNDKFSYAFIIFGFVAAIFFSLVYLFQYLITQGKGVGFGDIKYAFLLGLIFKQQTYFLFLISCGLGLLYALYLLIVKRESLKAKIPMGSIFSLAGFVMLLLHDQKFFSGIQAYLWIPDPFYLC
ncbi:MAG: hypothetical protein GF332_00865 [Candidatus Moranbacteria bacterium]|nr:hypothetical protein [Candidatus Moranbacteria bacterium]